MLSIYHYPSAAADERAAAITNRDLGIDPEIVAQVGRIIEDVRQNKDQAVLAYTRRFDCPDLAPDQLVVGKMEMAEAAARMTPEFTKALDLASNQIREFHQRQLTNSWFTAERPGTFLGQMVRPVDTAGLYVPGGREGQTPLVSSVLMGGIPARIAGVERLVIATPPTPEGTVNPHLLAAAHKVGADAIYKMGSAWAVAAMAFGTPSVPRADVIVGPGNVFVTLAKKMLVGTVGIDMIAGPSEILIIADKGATPAFLAADLLSQAEHDPLASSVLLTDAADIAEATLREVASQLAKLDRKEIAAQSLERFGAIFKVPDLDTAFELANRFAPEHLELHLGDPFARIGQVRHAGAVFIGEYTPEPVGDYIAGPNHVLPTAGAARFASALSVDHFIKKTSVLHYSRNAFRQQAADIIRLAEVEGLGAHANSVRVRLETP